MRLSSRGCGGLRATRPCGFPALSAAWPMIQPKPDRGARGEGRRDEGATCGSGTPPFEPTLSSKPGSPGLPDDLGFEPRRVRTLIYVATHARHGSNHAEFEHFDHVGSQTSSISNRRAGG
jgi:hypothetical protein